MPGWKHGILAFCAMLSCAAPTSVLARTWLVGPQRELKRPSDAAALARDGDRIAIDAGTYQDCAVWNAGNLTIAGQGNVVIQGPVCDGKALFVITGANALVRGVTFSHARARDRNGAGIRGEGIDLTVEDSRFIGNEDGILAGDNPRSHIVIRNSIFRENGVCAPLCAHGIYVNHIALLQVSGSTFFQQYEGHHIKSRAARSEIIGNNIQDGTAGTASYEVDIPDAGSLILKDNILEKGPQAKNSAAAVTIGEESMFNPTAELIVSGNRMVNDNDSTTLFVRNLTATSAVLTGNRLTGKIIALAGPGTVMP